MTGRAMGQRLVGQGLVARSCASARRSPAQAPGSFAQNEEQQRRELEALSAELKAERLRNQEQRRRFAAETRELKAALAREQQVLVERLQAQWEQRRALWEHQLQELDQRQRLAETRRLQRWKAAELRQTQALLWQECGAAARRAHHLQQALAEEMVRPTRSSREALSKLRDIVSQFPWETDGDQPAYIRILQNQLHLEKELFLSFLWWLKGELPTFPGTDQPQDPSGHQGDLKEQSSCSFGRNEPQALAAPQKSLPESQNTGHLAPGKAVADAQCQVLEGEELVLPGTIHRKLLEKNTCLQHLLQHLEKEASAIEMKATQLREGGSPEACKGAEKLQQKIAQLASLAMKLSERSRHLEQTINHLGNTQVPQPIHSSAEELCTAPLPQQRDGDMGEPGQLTPVPGEADSATQENICVPTQLEEAEHKLEAVREGAERSPQLEKEPKETKFLLQRKGRPLWRPKAELLRQHQEILQGFQACLVDLSDQMGKLNEHQELCQHREGLDRSSRMDPRQRQAPRDKESILLEAMRQQPFKLRAFVARHSYNPLHGPNQRPELELPLVAGQYVYIYGEADEDGWYVGELTDGTRGFVPSNLVEEASDDAPPDDSGDSSDGSDWSFLPIPSS